MSPTQYAYRAGHSTEGASVDVVGAISDKRDMGQVACATSCDLSKAFDCVSRDALLMKLEWYGISTHWFRDYFGGRTQSVKGSDRLESVNFGVVQGSILGPIVFNIFTNDLPCHLTDHCKIVSYADDSVLLHSAPPTAEGLMQLSRYVEEDLTAISTWFKLNGLKANPAKTEMSIFGTPTAVKKVSEFGVVFDGVHLTPNDHMNILGVTIDQTLSMEKQTAEVVRRCYGVLFTIQKLANTVPASTMKALVQTLVLPHVTYCLPAWAPPTCFLRQRVEKVLNFAARVVTKKRKYDHITEARQQLNWLSFDAIIQQRDCVLIHRLINQAEAPDNLRSLIEYRADVSERTTRASSDSVLNTRRCRLEATRRTVPVRPIQTWNGLPSELRQIGSSGAFKRRLNAALARRP